MEKQIMWAVYGPNGLIIWDTLHAKRSVCAHLFWEQTEMNEGTAENAGFAFRPVEVTITPIV